KHAYHEEEIHNNEMNLMQLIAQIPKPPVKPISPLQARVANGYFPRFFDTESVAPSTISQIVAILNSVLCLQLDHEVRVFFKESRLDSAFKLQWLLDQLKLDRIIKSDQCHEIIQDMNRQSGDANYWYISLTKDECYMIFQLEEKAPAQLRFAEETESAHNNNN
ncbi:MAG: hypothetical protein M3P33_04555, partial [bacterium]|nr:hypothetical protein [bacterium]